MAWSGTRADFERLVDDQLPAALKFAVRLTGSMDLAEDVVQDAMLAASRSWRTFRGDSEFRTWLFRIVIHAHRDRVAKGRQSVPLPDELEDARQWQADQHASARELGRLIARRVAKLPPRQREVLVLAVYEGLSPQQIAEALAISTENVYVTLSLARKRLRHELEPHVGATEK